MTIKGTGVFRLGGEKMAQESELERLLVTRGFVSADQLQKAQQDRSKILETGVNIDLDEILLRKGLLSPQQLALVNAALGKGRTDLIKGYEILSKLGQGGMGAVYKARQLSMDRIVAVKVLLPSFANEKNAVERFLREAKVIAKLSHPNLVSGIDAGFQNGIYYCVMEYVEGRTVSASLKEGKPLPWKTVVGIARNVAAALQHAEQHSIVHRDIKPDNIIIDKNGIAKLMDLGLAKLAGGRMQNNMSLTGSGFVVGTPHYMPPEQAQGQADIDIRADIYSLGLTMFEALCGKRPFDADTPLALLNKHISEQPHYEWLTQAGAPESVVQVVRKMSAKDRKQRHANCAELIADLDRSLSGKPPVRIVPARPTRKELPKPKKSMAPVFIIAAIVLLAVGIGIVLLPGPAKKPPAPPREEPKPIVEKKPEPPPPDPVVEKKEEPKKPEELPKYEETWQAALAFEKQSKIPEEILLNYLRAQEALRGTPRIADVQERIKAWIEPFDRQIRDEGNALVKRWEDMLAKDNFAHVQQQIEAVAGRCDDPLIKALDPEVRSAWMSTMVNWRGFLRDRVKERVQQQRDAAEAALKASNYEAATQAYEKMLEFGVEPAISEANRGLSQIAEHRKTYGEELERLTIRKYWTDACKEASQRNFDAAVARLKEAPLTLAPSKTSMAELIRDMELAGSVPKDVGKDLAPDKIVAAYATVTKSIPPADQTRALFLYALHSLEARTAERELQKLQKAGIKIRPEYEELYLKVQKEAEVLRARRAEAEAKLKKADQDDNSPKTLDNAIKLYEELLKDYKDVLTEKQIASINKRLDEIARGRPETVIDAKEFVLKGHVKRAVNDQSPLRDVVIIDDGDGPDAESYAQFEFEAKADTPYKLWLFMGYLDTDSNSVTVIFDGDVEISNAIGDDRGEHQYVIQYWPRSETRGFGWCDRDMRARNGAERTIDMNNSPGPTIKYKTAGKKRIRIHEAETGCPIARVLISSQKFLRAVPGAAETQPKK